METNTKTNVKVAVALLLGAMTAASFTSLQWLKADNDRLEANRVQLEVEVQSLQGRLEELQAERVRLTNK